MRKSSDSNTKHQSSIGSTNRVSLDASGTKCKSAAACPASGTLQLNTSNLPVHVKPYYKGPASVRAAGEAPLNSRDTRFGDELRNEFDPHEGATAAVCSRGGYPACVLVLPNSHYVAEVVPRNENKGWTPRNIASTLFRLLDKYEIQVKVILYEVNLNDVPAMQSLRRTCAQVATCWADLHEGVTAREIKLYIHSDWSDWSKIEGPTIGWRSDQTPKRDGYRDPVRMLDHMMIFAGETLGRVAIAREEYERLRDNEHDRFDEAPAHFVGVVR